MPATRASGTAAIAPPATPRTPSAQARVLALGGLTVLLYLATWLAERSLARNELLTWPSLIDAPYAAPSMSRLLLAAATYVAATLLIFWCYVTVLAMSRRGELCGRARLWALAIPILINLMLLPIAPRLSQDLFSYQAHGLLGVIAGGNPLLQGAEAARASVPGSHLLAYGWHAYPGITPYGILWTRLEVAIAAVSGGDVATALWLFKAVAVAASLGSAAMIWLVLGRIRPQLQLLGTLAYLWNPLVLMEFAAEGHNDALMIFFTLAALAACLSSKPAVSVSAQLLGVLTKYVPVLFLPAQLMYLWRTQPLRAGRRALAALALKVLLGAALTLGLAVVLYARFWAGVHASFFGLVHRPVPNGLASLFGVLGFLLRRTPVSAISDQLRVLLLTAPLLAYVCWSSLRLRSEQELTRALAWTSVIFLLISSPDYWPWYATMPIALMCVADVEQFLWLVLLLSLTGRLAAPSELVHDRGYFGVKESKAIISGLGSLLPCAVLLLRLGRDWRRGAIAAERGWRGWWPAWRVAASPRGAVETAVVPRASSD